MPFSTFPFPAARTSLATLGLAARRLWRLPWVRWVWVGIGLVGSLLAGVWVLLAKPGAPPAWQLWLVAVAEAALYWHGNLLLRFQLRRRLANHAHTARRRLLQAPLTVGLVAAFAFPTAEVLRLLSAAGTRLIPLYWQAGWSGLLVSLISISIYEGGSFFYELQLSLARAAALERESALSRLEALKQQVDPHFLFNCLNTMAALTGDNPPAQEFLGSLASVYRYVLTSKASATVPLSQEMTFVEAYLHLYRVRFGAGLVITQELPAEALRQHVPPLAVQMLLENAFKHNAFSTSAPLRISLRAEAGVLCVHNTVHRKTILEKSTRQGLQNIVNRYALLTDQPVAIAHRGHAFEVTLPLLPAP